MNAQIYSFDPACQTECEENQKKIGKMEEWNNEKAEYKETESKEWSVGVMEYWV